MNHVMIAIASEQRIQNIIPIFQRGSEFEKLWLVQSSDAERQGSRLFRAVEDTISTLNNVLQVKLAKPSVNAYSIIETKDVVANLITEESPNVIVNFTGGTKLMSIGAFLAAKIAGVVAVYVDTANERVLWFYPSGQVEKQQFDLRGRLTVDKHLQANGEKVDTSRTSRQELPPGAFAAAQELLELWPHYKVTLEKLGAAVSSGRSKCDSHTVDSQITTILAQHKLIKEIKVNGEAYWEPTQMGRSFVTGKWLEAMVYLLLRDSGFFDDIKINLCLQSIENELDIVVACNGQLAIIECKSGDLGGQTTLNKLQAIRTRFGIFARSFFVTSRQEKDVDNSFRNRANESRVRAIITSENLLQIAQEIKEKMRGVP